MAQAKKQTFQTAKGVSMYPWLNKPDTQFDAAGQYKTNLRMSKDDAKSLVDTLKQTAKEAFGDKADKARMPFKTDDETGDIIFTAKSKYSPKFCDTTGALIANQNVPQVYGGSVLKLSGNIAPYTAGGNNGISLQLAGVQILELADAVSVSFAAEEGSFVAANDDAPQAAEAGNYDF